MMIEYLAIPLCIIIIFLSFMYFSVSKENLDMHIEKTCLKMEIEILKKQADNLNNDIKFWKSTSLFYFNAINEALDNLNDN